MVVKLCGELIVCETVVCEQAGVNKPQLPEYMWRASGNHLGERSSLSVNYKEAIAVVHCDARALGFYSVS